MSGKPLGEILVTSGAIDRLHLASALSKQWSAQRSSDAAEETPVAKEAPLDVEPEPERAPEPEPTPTPTLAVADEQAEAGHSDVLAELVQAVRSLSAAVERLHGRLDAPNGHVAAGDDEPFAAITV